MRNMSLKLNWYVFLTVSFSLFPKFTLSKLTKSSIVLKKNKVFLLPSPGELRSMKRTKKKKKFRKGKVHIKTDRLSTAWLNRIIVERGWDPKLLSWEEILLIAKKESIWLSTTLKKDNPAQFDMLKLKVLTYQVARSSKKIESKKTCSLELNNIDLWEKCAWENSWTGRKEDKIVKLWNTWNQMLQSSSWTLRNNMQLWSPCMFQEVVTWKHSKESWERHT